MSTTASVAEYAPRIEALAHKLGLNYHPVDFELVFEVDATGAMRFGFYRDIPNKARRSSATLTEVEYLDYAGSPFRTDARSFEVRALLEDVEDVPSGAHAHDALGGDFLIGDRIGAGACRLSRCFTGSIPFSS